MTVFQYTALDAKGQEVQSEIKALSGKEAISKLRGQGLFPTKVRSKHSRKKVQPAAVIPKARRIRGRVKIRQITQFARQLSTLQDAGLAILRSLRILEQQQKPGAFKCIIKTVGDDIESGATLSEAMSKHPKAFNRLFVNMVAAGEIGGVLDIVLRRVADFMEKSIRLKSKIRGAMMYPMVVSIAAFFIVLGLMTFVMPVFAQFLVELGEDYNYTMPTLTLVLMRISEWLTAHYGINALLAGACPLLFVFLLHLVRRFSAGRYTLDWLKLHIPVLRAVVYKTTVARWTRTFATLIHAGVPILEVLKITSETADNEVYARMLCGAHRAIRQGDTFTRPLERSNTVDPIVVNMVQVGEETGELDTMLTKVADNFEEEADILIGSMTSILEPVMILILGGLIGLIVLAVFIPIIEILMRMIS